MQVPDKFIKLMMMTSSDNDGEALVALRKANAMLAEANVNWEEFLAAVGTMNSPPPSPPPPQRAPWHDEDDFTDIGRNARGHYDDADDINRLFEKAFARTPASSSFRRFLESVHDWWETNGFLTEKQYTAIRKSASR